MLVNLLIFILIAGLICYLIRWALGYMAVPDPLQKVVWVIVIIVLLLGLLRMLGIVGAGRVFIA
jgi:hypothetical protein